MAFPSTPGAQVANLALSDIVRVAVVCSVGNQFSQNVLHFNVNSLTSPGISIVQFAGQFGARIATQMRGLLANNARYEGVVCQVIKPVLGLRAVDVADAGIGTGGVGMAPSQTCGLIQKRTLEGGRKNRGRMYVPFPPAGAVASSGFCTALYQSALDDLAAEITFPVPLAEGPGAVTMNPIVYHRETGTGTAISSFNSMPAFATIRRRGYIGSGDANPLL